jgi:hypothetical protein
MSKDGRTYAIVKWNPGIERTFFSRIKQQGIVQTSFDTVRTSLDGKKGLLCWRGEQPPDLEGVLLWAGSLEELRPLLDTAEWAPQVAREQSAASYKTTLTYVSWGAAAAGAGALLYYFFV